MRTFKALKSSDWHPRNKFSTKNDKPSLTQQADARETDINLIMKRYEQTGQMPQSLKQPLFGDFTNAPDYRTAVETLNAAHDAFMEIPAKIRAQFGNDPQAFMEFAQNPDNAQELITMGLATAPPPRETTLEDIHNTLKEQNRGNRPEGDKPTGPTRQSNRQGKQGSEGLSSRESDD